MPRLPLTIDVSRTLADGAGCVFTAASAPPGSTVARYRTGATLSRFPRAGQDGFSLLEVLVATTVLTVGLAALAQLFVIATRANIGARMTTSASLLAQQKMEQLRALTWGFDVDGQPLSDISTNTAAVRQTPTGGVGLATSPSDALERNIDGYCDFLDRNGVSLGGGASPPAGTVFVRRWSIVPLPSHPDDTLILRVAVMPVRDRGFARTSRTARLPDEFRIVSVRTRKAR